MTFAVVLSIFVIYCLFGSTLFTLRWLMWLKLKHTMRGEMCDKSRKRKKIPNYGTEIEIELENEKTFEGRATDNRYPELERTEWRGIIKRHLRQHTILIPLHDNEWTNLWMCAVDVDSLHTRVWASSSLWLSLSNVHIVLSKFNYCRILSHDNWSTVMCVSSHFGPSILSTYVRHVVRYLCMHKHTNVCGCTCCSIYLVPLNSLCCWIRWGSVFDYTFYQLNNNNNNTYTLLMITTIKWETRNMFRFYGFLLRANVCVCTIYGYGSDACTRWLR